MDISTKESRKDKNRDFFSNLKNKFQILCNLNMDLEYAPIVITAYCVLYNFLIEEGDIGRDDQNKESNSIAPLKFEYICKKERRLKNIVK